MSKLIANSAAVHLLGLALLMTTSCATGQNQQTEQVEIQLSNAGFEALDADDSEAGVWLNTLSPRQLGPVKTADGTVRYVYADPEGCGCVYVGDKAAYQIFQARQQTRRESQDAEPEEEAEQGLVADECYDVVDQEGLR
ncbi:MAG: hypothetical protein E4H03_07695 [Myxococcales bacterium]|nr:MAG: hypothetical protein E4H03_07695 [Myxococcales bacterium]